MNAELEMQKLMLEGARTQISPALQSLSKDFEQKLIDMIDQELVNIDKTDEDQVVAFMVGGSLAAAYLASKIEEIQS